MRTDVLETVFSILTCTRAPKAFSKGRSEATSDGDIEEASGGRDDWTIVANSHDKGLVVCYCVFIQAVFGVDGSEGGRDIGWSRGNSYVSRDEKGEFGVGTGSGDGKQFEGSLD